MTQEAEYSSVPAGPGFGQYQNTGGTPRRVAWVYLQRLPGGLRVLQVTRPSRAPMLRSECKALRTMEDDARQAPEGDGAGQVLKVGDVVQHKKQRTIGTVAKLGEPGADGGQRVYMNPGPAGTEEYSHKCGGQVSQKLSRSPVTGRQQTGCLHGWSNTGN